VLGLDSSSWEAIDRPGLSIFGELDVDFFAVLDPASRRAPYDHCAGPDQYLVQIQAANHLSFTDFPLQLSISPVDQAVHEAVRMTTLAFFDAHLMGSPVGRAWLQGHEIEAASGGLCAAESKNLTDVSE
jgi:predicted dienelactone hydrolase